MQVKSTLTCAIIALGITAITNTNATITCPPTADMQQLLKKIQANSFQYTNDPHGFVGYHIHKSELIAAGAPADIINSKLLAKGGDVVLQVLRAHPTNSVKKGAPGYSLSNDPGIFEYMVFNSTSIPVCNYSYDLNGAPDGTAFLIASSN